MSIVERDPEDLARTVKFFRKWFRLSQENLADVAGLTTRTIEKIESGRHLPNEQTIRSVARAFDVNIALFNKPSPIDADRSRIEFERARRKMLFVRMRPVRAVADFLREFADRTCSHADTRAVREDEAVTFAASLADSFNDMGELWAEISETERVDLARSFMGECARLEQHGYLCFLGNYRAAEKTKGQADELITVNLMKVFPKAGRQEERLGRLDLEEGWETLEEDRLPARPVCKRDA